MLPVVVGKALAVIRECHAEEVPDDGGLAFGEVRHGDLADRDVWCGHGPEATGLDGERGTAWVPPIGWAVSGTFGRYLSGGAPAHPPYPTRRPIPDCWSMFSTRGTFAMDRTRLAPPQFRRLAIFLVAIALVAAISPGLAVAANGTPKPVDDAITTQVNEPATGNVLDNDINLGDGELTVTDWVDLDPAFGTLTIEDNGAYVFTPAVDVTGSASTTYTVANSSHEKDGTILITVTPINVAPVANDDTVTIDEDTPTDVTAQLLANDTDLDLDTLVVSGVSNDAGGTPRWRPTW